MFFLPLGLGTQSWLLTPIVPFFPYSVLPVPQGQCPYCTEFADSSWGSAFCLWKRWLHTFHEPLAPSPLDPCSSGQLLEDVALAASIMVKMVTISYKGAEVWSKVQSYYNDMESRGFGLALAG